MATFSEDYFKARNDNLSTHKVKFTVMTGPASYVTGGDAFNANTVFGWNSIDALLFCGVAWDGADAVRLLAWDRTNQKLLWFVPNTDAEVANGTDLSAFTVAVMAVGIG